jgi:leader peptidase (prepilin peptidase)/N-methyltransferase
VPLLALGLLLGPDDWPIRLAGAGLGGGLLWLLAWGYRRLRGTDGLGLGDVKLVAALGAWLGPWMLGPLLTIAAALGLLIAAATARRQPATDKRIPFGACLACTAFPLWLFLATVGGI